MTIRNLRDDAGPRRFGCDLCYGEEPPPDRFGHLDTVTRVIDDDHFIVSIDRCTSCGQRFVSIWTELTMRGSEGDASYTDVVPSTTRRRQGSPA